MSAKILPNLKYTDDHEWVLIEGDTATVGITDFAQNALGDIVFLEFPEAGESIEKGNSFGVVESIKSVSDLLAPISGEIIESNTDLCDTPDQVNQAAFESWMVKVKIADSSELDDLMDADAYQKHCDAQ